jgi:hypothetical protein
MAFSSLGSLGTTQNKTSASSITLTTTAAAAAGSLVVICVAKDNSATTDAENNEFTGASDSVGGNTWIEAIEYSRGAPGANNGASVAIYYSVLTNALASGSTITVNFDSARTAKAATAWNFGLAAGAGVEVLGLRGMASGTALPFGSSAWGAGVDNGVQLSAGDTNEVLAIYAAAFESNSTSVFTAAEWQRSAGAETTTIFPQAATSGGGSASNMCVCGGFNIFAPSGTQVTRVSVTSSAAGSDLSNAAIVLRETGGGEPPPRRRVVIFS